MNETCETVHKSNPESLAGLLHCPPHMCCPGKGLVV